MTLRTKLFQQLPWIGGVNTSVDDALIQPNELVRGDNIVSDYTRSRRKREGNDFNFDTRPVVDGTNEYGLFEFWFGSDSKQRFFLTANDQMEIHKYTTGGFATLLADSGRPWTNNPTVFSFLAFNNRAFIAAEGTGNLIKVWDGTSPNYQDLKNSYDQSIQGMGRSSSGTTRTLVLNATFKGLNGDFIIVSSASGPNGVFYNGTFQVTSVSTTNVANDTISFTATGSLIEAPTSDATLRVDGTAPQGEMLREHLGRIWTNDKTNRDRLHYSGTNNQFQWLGFGDSAALDVGVGDGDPFGIKAIFPTFKGELFVAKMTKLYKISGYTPETFTVQLVSSGIGCVSHNSITQVDQDDMFFVSEKGVHSITATANFGDFNSAYTSLDIQRTFNTSFSKARLKYVQGAYLPVINSVAFTFTDSNIASQNFTNLRVNNALWLYNIIRKEWYRWPDTPCQAMIVATDNDQKRFYFGTHTGKVVKSFNGRTHELDYNGNPFVIKLTVATGQINIDNSLYTVKGFKRFLLLYKPQGIEFITVTLQIDNIPIDPNNVLVYNETPVGDLLGINFILGISLLGSNTRLSSYSRSIDGYGRSVRIVIEESGLNQAVDIQGFALEYEDAGTSPEVIAR